MTFQDLPEFLSFLEEKGELKRIKIEVDPILEIPEIADRISKKKGPTLLFENVKGSSFPLVINTFGSFRRMSWALGVENLDEVAERIRGLLPKKLPSGFLQKVEMLLKLKELARVKPKVIKNAPCQEVVLTDNFSLLDLPVLKCWPQDGGRFITLPLVITKDIIGGNQNMGMYRLQVFDEKTTGMHWHIHHDGAANFREAAKEGKPFEVAVAIGGDPATIYAATAPLPRNFDELFFAGFLRGEPVEVVLGKTVNLTVPAHAEFVLEGYVDPVERRREGPFGDHTGYYSLADDYPVFRVKCITQKKNPIYPATIVGRPPMEDCYMGKATERIFLPFVQLQLPEVVDFDLPLEGVFHNC
ncbi:MAG: menaquinone biosynthesis decarboxylase, partial [Candidatus Subteraquimicrobiales bacterium]|nr:menaquinone biosynthesis decarboxylase [Candidatus Subteraquimicrobiales bacterium]